MNPIDCQVRPISRTPVFGGRWFGDPARDFLGAKEDLKIEPLTSLFCRRMHPVADCFRSTYEPKILFIAVSPDHRTDDDVVR